MTASILSLGSAVPEHSFSQDEILEKMIRIIGFDSAKEQVVKQLYKNSAIHNRFSVVPDFKKEQEEWHFWGKEFPHQSPGMTKRNEIYKKEAPLLAAQAARKALHMWGMDPKKISHIISVSCTGVVAPGIEFTLIPALDLSWNVNRLGINFMGCFGAFKGLSVARSIAKEDPTHRVLLVCTELCSLHLQTEQTQDNILANSLFSDGSAAVIVGQNPQANEKTLWSIQNQSSIGLENSLEKMAWEASDQGFFMKLSPQVPVLLGRHIKSFTDSLLKGQTNHQDCDWAIHPGGKSIVQAIEKAMSLDSSQTEASWKTLASYGNMSSATFLFVLEHLYSQANKRKWAIGVGFGPGLSMEGVLLKCG